VRRDKQLREMFDLLVLEHSAMLVSYLAAMTRSLPDAEDIAQEAFVKAYKNFEKFDKKGGNFAAWLRRIGRNTLIDRSRRAQRVVFSDPEILEGAEDVFAAADSYGRGDTWPERVESLRECLTRLPEPQRVVCGFHYFDGCTAKLIAQKLEIKLAAVLKRLQRARESLRACVERKMGLSQA